MICTHPLKMFLPNYIHRANDHVGILSKTLFIHLGMNYAQHSNTPVLQFSNTKLSAEPSICNLALRTSFKIWSKYVYDVN